MPPLSMAGAWGVTPHLPHSCGSNPSTLKCLFTFPFKVPTLNALNFSKFNALSFNKTLLLFLFRILLITLINKHSHKTPLNISILHAEPISAISPETVSVSSEINYCACYSFRHETFAPNGCRCLLSVSPYGSRIMRT